MINLFIPIIVFTMVLFYILFQDENITPPPQSGCDVGRQCVSGEFCDSGTCSTCDTCTDTSVKAACEWNTNATCEPPSECDIGNKCAAGEFCDSGTCTTCDTCTDTPVKAACAWNTNATCEPPGPKEGMKSCGMNMTRQRADGPNTSCVACPPGTYSLATNTQVCTSCVPGRLADNKMCTNDDDRVANDCAQTSQESCVHCPPGTVVEGTVCKACAGNLFQPAINGTKCITCPADADVGRYAAYSNAVCNANTTSIVLGVITTASESSYDVTITNNSSMPFTLNDFVLQINDGVETGGAVFTDYTAKSGKSKSAIQFTASTQCTSTKPCTLTPATPSPVIGHFTTSSIHISGSQKLNASYINSSKKIYAQGGGGLTIPPGTTYTLMPGVGITDGPFALIMYVQKSPGVYYAGIEASPEGTSSPGGENI